MGFFIEFFFFKFWIVGLNFCYMLIVFNFVLVIIYGLFWLLWVIIIIECFGFIMVFVFIYFIKMDS